MRRWDGLPSTGHDDFSLDSTYSSDLNPMIYFCIYFETQLKYLASAFVASFRRRIGKQANERHGEKRGFCRSLYSSRWDSFPARWHGFFLFGDRERERDQAPRISFCLPQTLPIKPCSLLYQRPRGPLLQWISRAPIFMQNDLRLSLLLSTHEECWPLALHFFPL